MRTLFSTGISTADLRYLKLDCSNGPLTGVVKLPYLTGAPASLENGMIWMESTGLHIYYGDAEKTVAGA